MGKRKLYNAAFLTSTDNLKKVAAGESTIATAQAKIASYFDVITELQARDALMAVDEETTWKREESIPSRVLEITEETITLECLVDAEQEVFENRVFNKKLLEGVIDIVPDKLMLIEISSRKGEIRYAFREGEHFVNPSVFKERDYFAGLENWPG